jgi:hypothetical protein
MNDPGLDGAIADAEKHHGVEDDIEQEEQEEEDLLLEPRSVYLMFHATSVLIC